MARWKDVEVYFPEHLEFCHLVSIWSFKNLFSQHWSKLVNPGAEMHRAVCRPFLNAFPVSELGARWLVGKMWKSTFQKNLNFFIWCPFEPSKTDCPITGQKWCMLVQKNIALIAGYFWMPSFSQNLAQDGSSESYGSIFSIETWIFSFGVQLSLQKLTVPSLVKMMNTSSEIIPWHLYFSHFS